MGKALEKVLELLPVPILILTASSFAFAWLLRELRRLPAWGDVLRARAFRMFTASGVAVVLIYYVISFSREWFPGSFAQGQTGVWVAGFENDANGIIQSHVFETTVEIQNQNAGLKDVHILKTSRRFTDAGAAKSFCQSTRATICIYGTFVPPQPLHVKISSSRGGGEIARFLDSYSNVSSLTAIILQALEAASRSQADIAKEDAAAQRFRSLEDSQRTILSKLDALTYRLGTGPPASVGSESGVVSLSARLSRERQRRRRALIVGISSYRELPRLSFSTSDATAIGQQLGGLWPNSFETVFLTDERATRSEILGAMDRLRATTAKDEQVWVYLNGHSVEQDGSAVFLPYDGQPKQLRATGIGLRDIHEWFSKLPADQGVMIVDTCYSGAAFAASRGPSTSLTSLLLPSAGRIVFAAAGPNEQSFEMASLGHGVFTNAILEGLRGAADANRDGIVLGGELAVFVQNDVARRALQAGFIQNPTFWSTVTPGDLVLSSEPANQALEPSARPR